MIIQLNDPVGECTALRNIQDVRKVLGLETDNCNNTEIITEICHSDEHNGMTVNNSTDTQSLRELSFGQRNNMCSTTNENEKENQQYQQEPALSRIQRVRRQSMEQLDLIKVFNSSHLMLLNLFK